MNDDQLIERLERIVKKRKVNENDVDEILEEVLADAIKGV